ncbi:hypothetical protein [Sinorhizobium meliloti]|uniref:hypothetical protein n=1 Tax=Rhizobium meliloti TaxID=382 RepID=UPI000B4A4F0C|nr:hypothetical protein [Sinorhizobium meliloti]ASQ11083.1 hypothetical protein CDO22_13530 [Sinorhizobium meliloti]MQU85744.1 hypothetical protein [Sinorhizobium meliloti]MQU89280.1 hypothetical protein [Sinorhizobium meliloti]
MSSERLERAIEAVTGNVSSDEQSKYTIDELIEAIGLTFGDVREELRAEIKQLRDEIEALKRKVKQ